MHQNQICYYLMWATNLKLNLRFLLTMNNWNKKNVPNTWVLLLTTNYHGKNSISKLLILNQRNSHNMQNAIYLQEKQLRNMYNAFIKPCLEYGWLTWGKGRGGEEETALSLIDKNICKTLRIMFGKIWDSATPPYQHFDILPLASNIKLLQSKFMKKLIEVENQNH